MSSLFAAYWERNIESQQQVDARRRDDMLYYFAHATARKAARVGFSPPTVGNFERKFPTGAIDNWSAAWKVRRFWEDQTELRKAAGKVIY